MSTDEIQKNPESKLSDIELKSSDAKEIVLPDGTRLQQALASNPDQFPSMANLAIPGTENIEPFQIVDDGKTIAASRKVEPVMDSFTAGLKALPEGSTPEQKAQFQIDYMLNKAAELEPSKTLLKGRVTNSLEITPGIRNTDDAVRFLGGLVEAVKNDALATIMHLSEPNAINNDIIASINFLAQDNSDFNKQLIDVGKTVLDKLSKPMTPEEIAGGVVAMSPWFGAGSKKAISQALAEKISGLTAAELKAMTSSERWSKFGVDYVKYKYRNAFFKKHPHLESMKKELEVHHEIPQQVLKGEFGKLFSPAEVHDLEFLKGVKKPAHDLITAEWEAFFFNNPKPTRADILKQINVIRKNYAGDLYP